MATLSGHRLSPSVNYYTGDSFSVDLSTAGFAALSTWTFTLHATSTSCTDQIGYDVYLQRPLPSTEACFHWDGITPSSDPTATITYGPLHVGDGVEWTSTAGATGCSDFTRVTFAIKAFTYPGACSVEWDWSITYTPSTSIAICAYGTQRKDPTAQVLLISAGIIATMIGLGVLAPYTYWALAAVVGTTLSLVDLCSHDKPVDQIINPADWTTPNPNGIGNAAQAKIIWNFGNAVWDAYCQCVPAPSGSPPAVSPPATIISAPTYLTHIDNVQIDNTEISTTINDLWQYFLTFNVGNNNNLTVGQQTNACSCTDFKLGTAHEGLTGDGILAVSGIHGLSVIFTTLPNRTGVDVGDPDKIYDVGWVNVGNDWGWQPPLYPDTTKWIVFPPDMHQMTQIGYSIPLDVVCTIAELVAA